MPTHDQAPVWARPEAFPQKPSSASESGAFPLYGYTDAKGGEHAFQTAEQLADAVAKSRDGIDLVWSPESERLIAPEEITQLRPTLWERRSTWAKGDFEDGKRMSMIFSAVLLYYIYSAYTKTHDLSSALLLPTVGIAAILLLIFGLVPLYEGWKTLRKGKPQNDQDWQSEIEESRFDSWLFRQKTPITLGLLTVMLIVGVTQLFTEDLSMDWSIKSVNEAGLLKRPTGTPGGEWWRYLTAPFLHGNLLHWLMNAAAIKYLARRVECLARWPHVLIVMVGAALVGGISTTYFIDQPSVGASGGIMGLLGFLLVFEVMHSRLVPKPTRRRLIAGVVMTALMGVMGFQFIDNAAHAGGLIAGMLYAAIVFPPSKSPHRPRIMQQDRLIATAAGLLILGGMIWTVLKLTAV